MSKFNNVYNSIKRRISIIVEDFSIKNSSFSNYKFNDDEDNNITCTFTINSNNEILNVLGKYFNNELSFVLTDESGNSTNYSEKEFATNYFNDYEGFKKALENYQNDDKATDDELGQIDSFDDELDDEINKDPIVKVQKTYEINGSTFLFKLLNDIAVENYCECVFDFQDEKTDEIIYVRSLLNILKKNSIIIKLLFFNDKGELVDKLTKSDFIKRYQNEFEKLDEAIKKFEKYIEEMK
jgi:hypothetical protein